MRFFPSAKFRVLLAGAICLVALPQTPITDSLVVAFPNAVQVGSQNLPAGEYTVKQINTASNPRLLEFSNDKGTSIQATATAIPVLDNNNRNDSSVLLETHGSVQVLRQIWIKGKSYGYEFPVDKDKLASAAGSREQIRLSAQYVPEQDAPRTLAQSQTAPQPGSEQPRAEQRPPAVAPTPAPAEPIAQPGRPTEAPRTQPELSAQAVPLAREEASAPIASMPATALDWPLLFLIGLGLFGTGSLALTLRRHC
jgi:hypothetical protein